MRVASGVRFSWLWLVLLAVLLPTVPASAQATRTWVSGVGDDVNPCSRTAPCKTFAGAISKTATAGEINVLDPGAFGAVTITKSITISSAGFEAGVLATLGSNGIVINAAASSVVVLRGLDIEGAGSGGNGIRFLAGAALHVEGCTINNFTGRGILFEPNGAAELVVRNSEIRNSVGANGGGIFVKPVSGGFARVAIDDVRLNNNTFGLRIEGGTQAVVSRSSATGNSTNGFLAVATAIGSAELNLDSCVASNNAAAGVRTDNFGATIRISQCTVTGNVQNGLLPNAGAIVSFGNNVVEGNGVNGSPTTTLPPV
jgi:hypothetical protein